MFSIYTYNEAGHRLWFTGPTCNQFTLMFDDVVRFSSWESALVQLQECKTVVTAHLNITRV